MKFARASGILLHPTSLPGPFGIGDIGTAAYRFADLLASTGQSLWQVLPLGPTGYGDSPYQCLSVAAGNPLLISPEALIADGLLEQSDLEPIPTFSAHAVDYAGAAEFKTALFHKSFETFQHDASATEQQDFDTFCQQNYHWLEDYALFMSLKEAHHLTAWYTWDEDIKARMPEAVRRWSNKLSHPMGCHRFQQYQFFRQWSQLKNYCHDRRIKLIGDIPIFVAHDSAEVWGHPELFYLDAEGMPAVVAGVPPDYFSETGQLWGNPIYRWDVLAQDGYAWWIERFRQMLSLVDVIRLDHFRGFEKYWEVPATETTAINGHWVPGPGADLFTALERTLGPLPIIAEDLGIITPEVEALRDQFDFPGIKVLQFAFSSDTGANPYKPHNFPRNCVVYTGTHDNNTTIGWFTDPVGDTTQTPEVKEKERRLALKYLVCNGTEINWGFIRAALGSVADMAIIPLQDVLGLGSEARLNRPATTSGNWRWRFTTDMLTDDVKYRLKELTALYDRCPVE